MWLRGWGPFGFCSLVVDYIPNPDLSPSTMWKDKEEEKKRPNQQKSGEETSLQCRKTK